MFKLQKESCEKLIDTFKTNLLNVKASGYYDAMNSPCVNYTFLDLTAITIDGDEIAFKFDFSGAYSIKDEITAVYQNNNGVLTLKNKDEWDPAELIREDIYLSGKKSDVSLCNRFTNAIDLTCLNYFDQIKDELICDMNLQQDNKLKYDYLF